MTDTQPLEPTDDELDELRQANSGRLNFVTFREFRVIARAVLAKWGAQPVERDEALIRQLVGALEGYRRNYNYRQACDAERAGRAWLEGN